MTTQLKRKDFYFLERLYTELVIWVLPWISRTRVTPNQVTIANYLNGFAVFALLACRRFVPAAILIQLYLFLDILDGNLARYGNMSTRLGSVLDHVGDRLFYNGFVIVLGLATPVHWAWILFFLVAHNLHGLTATFYLVPAIRKSENFRRFGLKKVLMERGYILGMDLSTQDLIMSILLVTPWRALIIPIVAGLYLADLIYRLIELWRNRRG